MASVSRREGDKFWRMQYIDRHGKRRQPTSGTDDRAEALRLAKLIEAKESGARGRLQGDENEDESPRVFEVDVLIERWKKFLLEKGGDTQHADYRPKQVSKMMALVDIRDPDEISLETVEMAQAKLRKFGEFRRGKRRRLSESTIDSYRVSCKSFAKWLVEIGRLLTNPLADAPARHQSETRGIRRYLTLKEWKRLKSRVLAKSALQFNMEAEDRLLLYAVSLITGFWADELRSLTRGDVNLDNRTIVCKKENTHNKRPAAQRITIDLAVALRSHIIIHRLKPADSLFVMPAESGTSDMFCADARDAKLAEFDDHEQRLTFHSLQYTCGVWLIQSKVYPSTVQHFMRYVNYQAFEAAYGHLLPISETETVDRLPALMLPHSPYKEK